ncbi:glycosyltransferase [Sphingobacterium spiritivorum]|uniref:glycosyltransferase n=1 Tax=Sphingobacterium spiritivorum TaxID=258 RepID=UPI003DA1FDC9
MKPKISIIFTSYNHREYLVQSLNSLIEQTYRDFELIIVDDCSTDGSQDILKEYQKYPFVRLFLNQINSGSYVKASNFGAEKAIGEYIIFAQCDDFAEPNQLEKLVEHVSEDFGVIFSKSVLIDANNKVLGDDFSLREKSFREFCKNGGGISGSMMSQFLSKGCVIPNLSAALIRKDLYSRVGGLSEKYLVAADWDFWLKLSLITNFYYINSPLNNFRQHEATIRSSIKITKQILEIYNIFYDFISQNNLSKAAIRDFQVGAGAIWISFFKSDKRSWVQSFISISRETSKFEKHNIWFLWLGFIYKVKEVVNR